MSLQWSDSLTQFNFMGVSFSSLVWMETSLMGWKLYLIKELLAQFDILKLLHVYSGQTCWLFNGSAIIIKAYNFFPSYFAYLIAFPLLYFMLESSYSVALSNFILK